MKKHCADSCAHLTTELYDRLFKSTERPDILMVLHHLHDASQDRHLPAFQRCVEGRSDCDAVGCGRGRG